MDFSRVFVAVQQLRRWSHLIDNFAALHLPQFGLVAQLKQLLNDWTILDHDPVNMLVHFRHQSQPLLVLFHPPKRLYLLCALLHRLKIFFLILPYQFGSCVQSLNLVHTLCLLGQTVIKARLSFLQHQYKPLYSLSTLSQIGYIGNMRKITARINFNIIFPTTTPIISFRDLQIFINIQFYLLSPPNKYTVGHELILASRFVVIITAGRDVSQRISIVQVKQYITSDIVFISFSFISVMRKVLAVASVGPQHKELVLKDLKDIFKRIKISLDVLLQQEMQDEDGLSNGNGSTILKSYPYITLTIPNYEQHRQYLEKVYKNNVLFSKFILLISEGKTYEQLIVNRNEDILREQCRNWNSSVSCEFDSSPVWTDIEDQMSRIDKILGEMDIRGKINKIDAQKRFHLIEDHRDDDVSDPHPVKDVNVPTQKGLLKLFFGLELCSKRGRGRQGVGANAGGIVIAADSRYAESQEFIEYEEETAYEQGMSMEIMDEMNNNSNVESVNQQQSIQQQNIFWQTNGSADLRGRRILEKRSCKRRIQKLILKENHKNPYLKKKYADEVVLSHVATQVTN